MQDDLSYSIFYQHMLCQMELRLIEILKFTLIGWVGKAKRLFQGEMRVGAGESLAERYYIVVACATDVWQHFCGVNLTGKKIHIDMQLMHLTI